MVTFVDVSSLQSLADCRSMCFTHCRVWIQFMYWLHQSCDSVVWCNIYSVLIHTSIYFLSFTVCS